MNVVDQADEGDEADGVTAPHCASYCNSSAQCTDTCKTEALCISHHLYGAVSEAERPGQGT